jgi:hypothetical protein
VFAYGFAALRCIADFQSAGIARAQHRGFGPRSADWKSAIQQVGNLRYDTAARSWRRLPVYQYLPKSSQPAKFYLTTDGHGLTRMETAFLLSVSIRVHPWLDRIGCGLAALRCIADFQSSTAALF